MGKIRFALLVFLLIFSVHLYSANAIRISPDSIRIEFEPNFEKSYTFYTERADSVQVTIEGDLAKYVTIEKDNIAKDGTFVIKVKLPAEIETPGKNLVFVGVTEGGTGNSMVSGIASIRTPIDIRVPYPGIYAETSFIVHDLNINETTNFIVAIHNMGKNSITNAKAVIDIFDTKERLIEKIFTQEKAVNVNSKENLEAFFDASKHTAGMYKAIAHLTYADRSQDLDSNFKIGALNIQIINYTKAFFKGKIGKFDLEVESGWNNKIDNVFAEVKIFNNTKEISSFKTISFGLEPWERKKISTFWDNEWLDEGTYDAEINLFYEGKITKVIGKIGIIMPKEKISFKKYLTTTSVLILVVIALIIINIAVLISKRKK